MRDGPVAMLKSLPFTFAALRSVYAAGVTPRQVVAEVYARIRAVDDPGIFIHLADEAEALALAEALGARNLRLPLWGLPFVVKDNIDVAGMPTTAACPAFSYSPEADAFVVARLRRAGAIPIGKTNLDQFATGLVGVRSPYPVPRNAIDAAIVPGGSSSGSAVAVAHGIVAFALGTDTAGSGRVPAALNNIVGLKPTVGALSAGGVVPACRTLDTISVFALTVADAHDVLQAATAPDPDDAFSRSIRVGALPAPLPAPRIAVPDAASLKFCGDAVQAAAFETTVLRLEATGATISRVDFGPFYDVARMLYEGAWVAERYTVIEDLLKHNPDAVHRVTRAIIGKAAGLSAADAFRGIYRLEELKQRCAPILKAADMICVPSIPTFYTLEVLAADPFTPNTNLGTYTNFVNLLDLCALTVPTAPRSDGRPGSITLIGRAGADGILAAEGVRIEAMMRIRPGATGWEILTQPPTARLQPEPDEIALAVCGAHMSGLPLNHELTRRGARFLGSARSAPVYSLHALAGGPPYRPGMVRRRDQSGGVAVELEVWGLPKTELGDFVAGIPAPLGIGSVELDTGDRVMGFLCESAGLTGAKDISDYRGWRAFCAATAQRAGEPVK